jgi:PII-like signaling protein
MHGRRPLWREVLEALRRHGMAGATATKGLVGFGASGRLHEDLTPDARPDAPITIEAFDSAEAIDRVLPDVEALVDEGLVAVHDVPAARFRKRAGDPLRASQHQKLTGRARMLRVHIGANDRWDGEPLHEALVKRFHQLDLAGATVYRGLAGYGASGRIHRRAVWRSHDEPITVVVVDTADKLEKAFPYLDRMVPSGLVALSDVEVILYRPL